LLAGPATATVLAAARWLSWLDVKACVLHCFDHICSFHLFTLHLQEFVRIVCIYFPVLNTRYLIDKVGNGSDAITTIDIGLEF